MTGTNWDRFSGAFKQGDSVVESRSGKACSVVNIDSHDWRHEHELNAAPQPPVKLAHVMGDCLTSLGEKRFDVSLVTEVVSPDVSWGVTPANVLLRDLCNRFGYRVVLSDDAVRVLPVGPRLPQRFHA